jgi:hypothetical protein
MCHHGPSMLKNEMKNIFRYRPSRISWHDDVVYSNATSSTTLSFYKKLRFLNFNMNFNLKNSKKDPLLSQTPPKVPLFSPEEEKAIDYNNSVASTK